MGQALRVPWWTEDGSNVAPTLQAHSVVGKAGDSVYAYQKVHVYACASVCVCTHAHAQRSGTRVVKEQPSDCWGADGPDRVGIGADSEALRAGRGVGALGGGGRQRSLILILRAPGLFCVSPFAFSLF